MHNIIHVNLSKILGTWVTALEAQPAQGVLWVHTVQMHGCLLSCYSHIDFHKVIMHFLYILLYLHNQLVTGVLWPNDEPLRSFWHECSGFYSRFSLILETGDCSPGVQIDGCVTLDQRPYIKIYKVFALDRYMVLSKWFNVMLVALQNCCRLATILTIR